MITAAPAAPWQADVTVFGEWGPQGPAPYGTGVKRDCREHGVAWRGDAPCWLCEAVERG